MHTWPLEHDSTNTSLDYATDLTPTSPGESAGPATSVDALRDAAAALHGMANALTDQATMIATVRRGLGSAGDSPAGFQYVKGFSEITAAIQLSLDGAKSEILTAQPDGPRSSQILTKALEAVRERLEAGVGMRTLYQHSTRFDEPTKEYVRAATGYGAQIRTLAEFFDRLIIIDQRVAFVPASSDRSAALIVSEPAMVKFLADFFERAWDRAEPYPFLPVRATEAATEIVPAMRDAICKLLVEGRSDREIARRLGFSLRSLQSHVARLKEQYGAEHRLQLGYLMGVEAATQRRVTEKQDPGDEPSGMDDSPLTDPRFAP